MEIIANHAHIFQESVNKDGSIGALKKVMEECEIDKAVCFAPFDLYFAPEGGKSQNRWLYDEIKNDDSLLAFGTIDFTKDNIKEQAEEIYELGFDGIKIHPAYQRIKVDGEKACQVYEVAEKRGLPISFHTGIHWHRISSYNTLLYDEIAYRFPEIKICMEHVGGYAFFNEAIAVMCNNRERIYAGLTSVFDHEINKFWYLGKEKVKDIIWLTGVDYCVFGLDFPYNSVEKIKEAKQAMREVIEELNLGDEAMAKVFGGNLLRMIGKNK